jgi:[acyl-carrier-protein] S-malonyltransferase
MAAVLGLDDGIVEKICAEIEEEVVPANYNCPGQLVISGSLEGVQKACEQLKAVGAKRALLLPVGGAFHSPLMLKAEEELVQAIESVTFNKPVCPVYQNVVTWPVIRIADIKVNLMHQLTRPVKWTQSVRAMVAGDATEFTEVGPGKVLQGLVQKIHKEAVVNGVN